MHLHTQLGCSLLASCGQRRVDGCVIINFTMPYKKAGGGNQRTTYTQCEAMQHLGLVRVVVERTQHVDWSLVFAVEQRHASP